MNTMLTPNQPSYKDKLLALSQALFYVYNEEGNKVSAGIVHQFQITEEGDICFYLDRLPLMNANWNTYAAELYCYKKGTPYNIQLSGIATVSYKEAPFICFRIDAVADTSGSEADQHSYWQKILSFKHWLSYNFSQSHWFKLDKLFYH